MLSVTGIWYVAALLIKNIEPRTKNKEPRQRRKKKEETPLCKQTKRGSLFLVLPDLLWKYLNKKYLTTKEPRTKNKNKEQRLKKKERTLLC